MTVPRDPLREAFAAAEPSAEEIAACPSAEEIWDAAHGELPAERTREIVALAAENAAVAEVWRQAVALGGGVEVVEETGGGTVAEFPLERRRPPRPAAWLALAAVATFAVLGIWRLIAPLPDEPAIVRDPRTAAGPKSLIEEDAELPRDAFVLRWSAGGEETRYDLRVFTEELEPVAEAFDLETSSHRVDPEALAPVADGTRLLWQVRTRLANGGEARSDTFTAVVAPSAGDRQPDG